MRSGFTVLLVILGKFLPKFLTLFLKLVSAKFSLAALSFGSYAIIFSWQFAVAIMAMLIIHEGGHYWAMKHIGMKTKGIYLIPFVGGVAVAESHFPSHRSGVFVALMGPLMGLTLAIVSALLYFATQNLLFAAAAGWMAYVNLLNLMPVNPLDGGRVLRAICFSIHTWIGLVLLAAACIACAVIMFYFQFWLFLVFLVVGCIETVAAFRRRYEVPAMRPNEVALSVVAYLFLAGVLGGLLFLMAEIPGADSALLFARE